MPSINTHYAYFLPSGKNGIVHSWKECEKIVYGIQGARYKGFRNEKEGKFMARL